MLDAINIFCEPTVSVNDIAAIQFFSYDPDPIPYGQTVTTIYGTGFSRLPQGRLYNATSSTDGDVTIISDTELQANLGAAPHAGTWLLDYVDENYNVILPGVLSVTFGA
jgi:hypothetical protein